MRLTTLAAALTLLASASLTHAQSAKYCTNTLVANSFYSNVISNGSSSEVEYHGQFQNQDPKRQTLIATLATITKVGTFNVTRPISHFELSPYQQKDIVLFRLQVKNPGGSGAPTPAEVGKTIRFTCAYKPN